jgi:hypothetical protein
MEEVADFDEVDSAIQCRMGTNTEFAAPLAVIWAHLV